MIHYVTAVSCHILAISAQVMLNVQTNIKQLYRTFSLDIFCGDYWSKGRPYFIQKKTFAICLGQLSKSTRFLLSKKNTSAPLLYRLLINWYEFSAHENPFLFSDKVHATMFKFDFKTSCFNCSRLYHGATINNCFW